MTACARRFALVTALWLCATLPLCAALPLRADDAAPAWSPDPAQIAKLGSPEPIGAYRLRVPTGYTYLAVHGQIHSTINAWVGPVRDDGTHPYLLLLIVPRSEESDVGSVHDELIERLHGVAKMRIEWTHDPIERGNIGAYPFQRSHWQGLTPDRKWKVSGVLYVSADAANYIVIASHDLAPYAADSLPVAEAAAQTFEKALP